MPISASSSGRWYYTDNTLKPNEGWLSREPLMSKVVGIYEKVPEPPHEPYPFEWD